MEGIISNIYEAFESFSHITFQLVILLRCFNKEALEIHVWVDVEKICLYKID